MVCTSLSVCLSIPTTLLCRLPSEYIFKQWNEEFPYSAIFFFFSLWPILENLRAAVVAVGCDEDSAGNFHYTLIGGAGQLSSSACRCGHDGFLNGKTQREREREV